MTTDLSPRADCPIGDACGYGTCRECHWGELPGMAEVCGRAVAEAEEARCDRAAMAALESAFDWRPAERLLAGGAPGALADARTKKARFETTARPEKNP